MEFLLATIIFLIPVAVVAGIFRLVLGVSESQSYQRKLLNELQIIREMLEKQ